MTSVPTLEVGAVPIATRDRDAASGRAASTLERADVLGVELPQGVVAGQLLARGDIAPGRKRHFILHPDVGIAGVVQAVLSGVVALELDPAVGEPNVPAVCTAVKFALVNGADIIRVENGVRPDGHDLTCSDEGQGERTAPMKWGLTNLDARINPGQVRDLHFPSLMSA